MREYLSIEWPDVCSEPACGLPIAPTESRLVVLLARAVEGPVVGLQAAVEPRSFHLRCAPPPGSPGRVVEGVERSRNVRPVVYGVEHWGEVALAYRSGGAEPTKAVADGFSVSRSTAAKWVARCRELGLLEPTTQGVAGG